MLYEGILGSVQDARIRGQVDRILASLRRHLKMDVGFVSEFSGGKRIFKYVNGDGIVPVREGAWDPLEQSYCYYVVNGRVPEVLRDAKEHPLTGSMKVTHELPVGAHLSVPIRFTDGSIYGTLCCFRRLPDRSLGKKALEVIRACADMVSNLIEDALSVSNSLREKKIRIGHVIEHRSVQIVYQPIYRLADNRLVNFEALARFPHHPPRSPDVWFDEANEVGAGPTLELIAIEAALEGLSQLPVETSLSLNLSPGTALTPEFHRLFEASACARLILELTEHAPVTDYEEMKRNLAPYRAKGLRLAIDDVGAGHASFRHIVDLQPDLIKLDCLLTRNIDTDLARRTLAKAITSFGRTMGCEVVAEGVETSSELATLREAGATKVQGYLLGRPMALAQAARLPPTFSCSLESLNDRLSVKL